MGLFGRKKQPAIQPLESIEEADALIEGDEAVWLYKHSTTCPIATTAQINVERYLGQEGALRCRQVTVQTHRDVSNHIAEQTGVRHESPQALLVRGGEVLWHASHNAITQQALTEAAQQHG